MRLSERWKNDAKLPWELATVGANFPGRVDMVSMLKRWRRVPVRTRVAVGTGQDQAPAGHKRQQRELQLE